MQASVAVANAVANAHTLAAEQANIETELAERIVKVRQPSLPTRFHSNEVIHFCMPNHRLSR